jgi:predicted heme/steroid binding protein
VEKRSFTKRELRRRNGKHGARAFIAYEGRIYDVSGSFLWQNGRHEAIHDAGTDLTGSLAEAPHGADLLKKFPIVGSLKKE